MPSDYFKNVKCPHYVRKIRMNEKHYKLENKVLPEAASIFFFKVIKDFERKKEGTGQVRNTNIFKVLT